MSQDLTYADIKSQDKYFIASLLINVIFNFKYLFLSIKFISLNKTK